MTAETNAATAGEVVPGRPARPARPAGYWERIDRIVDAAPPLGNEQRAAIRVAIWGGHTVRTEAAA